MGAFSGESHDILVDALCYTGAMRLAYPPLVRRFGSFYAEELVFQRTLHSDYCSIGFLFPFRHNLSILMQRIVHAIKKFMFFRKNIFF